MLFLVKMNIIVYLDMGRIDGRIKIIGREYCWVTRPSNLGCSYELNYFFFKLAIVGSIFGVARLFINKVHNIYSVKYNKPEPPVIEKTDYHFGKYVISKYYKDISVEIERLLKLMVKKDMSYIHRDDIDDLRKFIDSYEEYIREKTKEV